MPESLPVKSLRLTTTWLSKRRLSYRVVSVTGPHASFSTSWLSVLDVRWVTPEIHDAAVVALLAGSRRSTSLVDFVSFEVMRRLGIRTAFTFDRDFGRAGFRTVPSRGRPGATDLE